ncbi:hypothetical protein TNCT_396691 [Trichonephila clavata]|uniref:Uncharacterized protein n=1 Tax=Trichonephila clavata TaxID=2740835 RepID=A0A8X6FFM6_TRICU|nr:hypothetical protein TNCT_396691 [Trichonephila clavata]
MKNKHRRRQQAKHQQLWPRRTRQYPRAACLSITRDWHSCCTGWLYAPRWTRDYLKTVGKAMDNTDVQQIALKGRFAEWYFKTCLPKDVMFKSIGRRLSAAKTSTTAHGCARGSQSLKFL